MQRKSVAIGIAALFAGAISGNAQQSTLLKNVYIRNVDRIVAVHHRGELLGRTLVGARP